MSAYIYALLSNISWGLGAQFYTHYSKKLSPMWTNIFKGTLGFILFGLTAILTGGFTPAPPAAIGLFMLSGFIGLGFADVFLLKSFTQIGPARTMIIFSFQPLIVGVISYFLFGQQVDLYKFLSIIFFLACVIIFTLEGYKKTSKWQFGVLLIALLGVCLDAAGVIITRTAFDASNISSIQANTYRCLGALPAFAIAARIFKVKFFETLRTLKKHSLLNITFGATVGTFCCLMFYLKAVSFGHLATVTAMSMTSVIFSAIFECLFERKWPSKYLLVAFGCFGCAAYILFALG